MDLSKSEMEDTKINESATIKIQADAKFTRYISWLKMNGVLFESVDFPAAFGRFGYYGIAAKHDLPAGKAIISIPNKLIITIYTIQQTVISKIIEKNLEIFCEDYNIDGDFHTLVLFMFWERCKEDSFYAPMFAVSENNYSLLGWTNEQIDLLEDIHLKEQTEELHKLREESWQQMKEIIKDFPDIFDNSRMDLKQIYDWAYEFVLTRSFGFNLPSAILIPLADFVNHTKHKMIDHRLIHVGLEKNASPLFPNYQPILNHIDLSEVNIDKTNNIPQNSIKNDSFSEKACNYINENSHRLEKSDQEKFSGNRCENCERAFFREFIGKINLKQIQKSEEKHFYDYPFFETSDEDEDEIDEKSNQTEQTQKEKYQWYSPKDTSIYFILYTLTEIKKNQQIFYSYGRRDNRLLLLWYGFSVEKNVYDFIPIKFLLDKEETFFNDLEENIFLNYISNEENETNCFSQRGKSFSLDVLSKEFKIKSTRFCQDLLDFFRMKMLKKEQNCEKLSEKNAHNFDLEIECLEYLKRTMNFISSKMKTSLEDDENIIKFEKESTVRYFCAIFRKSKKVIIREQLKMIDLCVSIIKNLKTGMKFKESYMYQNDKYDISEREFIRNRSKISSYLKKLSLLI